MPYNRNEQIVNNTVNSFSYLRNERLTFDLLYAAANIILCGYDPLKYNMSSEEIISENMNPGLLALCYDVHYFKFNNEEVIKNMFTVYGDQIDQEGYLAGFINKLRNDIRQSQENITEYKENCGDFTKMEWHSLCEKKTGEVFVLIGLCFCGINYIVQKFPDYIQYLNNFCNKLKI